MSKYTVCFEIVDLHLRTKADLYSFMQCSFVKIQDLIGYVSEYTLMRPKPTYKATYVHANSFVMIWTRIKLLLASANSVPGPVLYIYRNYIL